MGGQYGSEGLISKTIYHMFHQRLFYMASMGEVRNFRMDMEDRMEKKLV